MPAEQVIPLALSGEEIRKAILDRLSQHLEKDGYLNMNLAYDYYSAKVTIEVMCHDVGREASVNVTDTVRLGTTSADLDEHEGGFEIEAKPPNEERVETGQGVPVQTKDSNGRPEVKHIRYGRNKAKAKV